jgi:hypothetical protein
MGTRSETVIWDGNSMIVLFKHWDGYPDYMLEFFREVVEFACYMCKDQIHWLNYAEDVASYIIGYDGIVSKECRDKYGYSKNIDFRPIGNVTDYVEYVYVLDVSKAFREGRWMISVYQVEEKFWKLSRRERDSIYKKIVKKNMKFDEYLELMDKIELKLNITEKPTILIEPKI